MAYEGTVTGQIGADRGGAGFDTGPHYEGYDWCWRALLVNEDQRIGEFGYLVIDEK